MAKRPQVVSQNATSGPQRPGAQQIEQIATEDLIPYARNARTHSEQQVGQIAGSIQEFGFNNPVLIDGQNSIIAGHGRVLAAQRLKLETVPCIRLTHLTDAQRRAYVLADNRIALNSGWDEAMLSVELAELHAEELDLGLLGFEAGELEKLMGFELGEGNEEIIEDETPEPPADPITKPGDLWLLGDHRLLCGDSTKAEDVKRLMAGAKARYGMFDPPYGIAVIGGVSKAKGSIGGVSKAKANEYEPIHGDDKPFDPAPFFGLAEECVWWGANYFADKLPCKKGWIVWDKKGREWNDNFSDCEMAWTPFKTVARIYRHVWMGLVQEGERELRQHPTQKPVAMFAKLMRELFTDDGVVLDLWLGSGTTLIAAEQLGRKCYGMEISPAYCDVIVKRWETLTGRKAQLEAP